jgi:hypothetical protein
MKIEFRPDFRIHPVFKAIWPKLKEAFMGLKFRPEIYGVMMRKVFVVLSCALLLILVVLLLLKIL